MSSIRLVLDSALARVSVWSRRRKAGSLLQLLEPGASVLLVGAEGGGGDGRNSNLVELSLAKVCDVTAVYYDERPDMRLRAAGVRLVRADGKRLPFKDHSFDYVVSNAVIEHVGIMNDITNFLSESRRVARLCSIHTTPNRWFPIETHTGIPLLHWLPRTLHASLLRNKRYRFSVDDTLLSAHDLRRLSPRATVTGQPAICALTLVLVEYAK